MPSGSTTVGRVQVPVQASGNGADLQVTLCPDNGSGSPNLAGALASVTVPASHILAWSAPGSLASAGPLALARYNTSLVGDYSTGPWAQPAVSSNGAGSFATPATSGNFTVLAGGYDSTANTAAGTVSVIAYQGTSVSGGATQPSLPQPAWYTCATVTSDSVVVAGGRNTTTEFATAWTAPWSPGTGAVGAWSAQQALPSAVVYGAMVSWGTQVYVIGGSPNAAAASATSAVWTASSQSGQITAWTACPPLPQALMQAYAAVVGNWLIVAGGVNTAGNPVSSCWYTEINSDGSLAGWRQGPALPQSCFSFSPGWNLAVTDSAVMIISGTATTGTVSTYTQVLSVDPTGVADAWQLQNWGGSTYGEYQVAAYPAGPSGEWQVFNLHTTSYDTAQLGPVPLISVPLPVSGLTPGATYHVVMHQSGGSLNDSLQVGIMVSAPPTHWLSAPVGTGGPWTSQPGQVAMNVLDRTAGGPVLHLTEDAGARVTSPVWASATGQLAGLTESVVFPAGSPEAVLGTVTEVVWTDGYPTGLVNLA